MPSSFLPNNCKDFLHRCILHLAFLSLWLLSDISPAVAYYQHKQQKNAWFKYILDSVIKSKQKTIIRLKAREENQD